MRSRLIIEGNAVYEIDEGCMERQCGQMRVKSSSKERGQKNHTVHFQNSGEQGTKENGRR